MIIPLYEMKIYICTPIASGERTREEVIARIDELKRRLSERDMEGVSHLDHPNKGCWAENVGANVALLLECDGILLDNNRKNSRVCQLEEAISKVIPSYKKNFYFFHSREEFDFLNDRYVI